MECEFYLNQWFKKTGLQKIVQFKKTLPLNFRYIFVTGCKAWYKKHWVLP